MSRSPWPPGTSAPFVDGLIARLGVRPEVAVFVSFRVKKRLEGGEDGGFGCTYSGSDPTEDLLMRLTDSLIACERLRIEVMAPLMDSPGGAPAIFSTIATELLPVETHLVEAICRVIRVNGVAWSEHRVEGS